jgi:hypothetical protein
MSEPERPEDTDRKLIEQAQGKYLLPPERATPLTAREWVALRNKRQQQYAIRD